MSGEKNQGISAGAAAPQLIQPKGELCTGTALWQAGEEEERAARKNTAVHKDVFIAEPCLVTQEKGRGLRNRKERSER